MLAARSRAPLDSLSGHRGSCWIEWRYRPCSKCCPTRALVLPPQAHLLYPLRAPRCLQQAIEERRSGFPVEICLMLCYPKAAIPYSSRKGCGGKKHAAGGRSAPKISYCSTVFVLWFVDRTEDGHRPRRRLDVEIRHNRRLNVSRHKSEYSRVVSHRERI